jgi:peptidoglycan/LPS O-acetylase OafA/YrhL
MVVYLVLMHFVHLHFYGYQNSHMQEGLKKYYDVSYTAWMHTQSPALLASSNGVIVFFVISGFLNLMVSMSLAKKYKVRFLQFIFLFILLILIE